MNVGGAGTPTRDGEMSPRLAVAATPYALSAQSLSSYNTSNGDNSTMTFATATANNTITLPNASGTVCLQSSSSCGFATGSGSAFLQGGDSYGAPALLGTLDSNALHIETAGNTVATFGISGSLALENSANSASALQVQNAAGTGLFNVNTDDTSVNVNASLQVSGVDITGLSAAVVQRANGASTGTATASFSSDTTAGNTIVLMAQVSSATEVVQSVAGAGVSSWHQIAGATIDTGGYDTEMWYGDVTISGSGTITVVESGGASDNVRLIAAEVSGLVSSPVDQATATTYTSTTSPVTPTINTTASNEIVFGYAKDLGTGSTISSPTNGFTALTSPVVYNALAYEVTSSSGAYSTGWTASPAIREK